MRPQVRLVVIAVAAGAVQIGMTTFLAARGIHNDRMAPDLLGYALLVTPAVALLGSLRWPVAAASAAVVATTAYLSLGYSPGPVVISMMISMVFAVLAGHRRAAWGLGLGGLAIFSFFEVMRAGDEFPLVSLVMHVAWMLVLLLAAEFLKARRERGEAGRRRAEDEQRRRASEERLAIARELHDVVAHSIAVINVQAGTALHLRDDVDRAFETLRTIRTVSADTLHELRQTLDVLRSDNGSPRLPSPGLHSLSDLVGQAEAAGLVVELDLDGVPGDADDADDAGDSRVPTAVGQAGYRIVQEAVTNVIRHAGSDTVRIEVSWRDDRLGVAVLDRGRGLPVAPAPGNGLRGMRERVEALGGELSVLPRPGGGCVVRAGLPAPRPVGRSQ